MTKDAAILDLHTLLAQNYDQRDQLIKEAEDIERLLNDNSRQRSQILELIKKLRGSMTFINKKGIAN